MLRACYFNKTETAEILIKHGADLEHRSQQDMTPLITAIFRGKVKIVELLLAHEAKLDLKTENLGGLEKIKDMNPDIKKAIETHLKWIRTSQILKFH